MEDSLSYLDNLLPLISRWNERATPYKKLYAYARTESARTKFKVNTGVLRQMKTMIVLVRVCEIRR